ncbi:hypothetical protein Tco_1425466 [Tanacetum coccineum]
MGSLNDRTINNLIRPLLFQANLPPTFWVEALNMATHLEALAKKQAPFGVRSAWKEMHTDKAGPCSSYSFLEKPYTSHDLRSYDPPFYISCSKES